MVQLKTQTYAARGTFLLPTVVREPATVLYVLYSLLDPGAQLTTDDSNEPLAQSPNGDFQMAASQYLSTLVALEAAGYSVRGELQGLRILRLFDESPNREALRPGDLLVAVDGSDTRSISALRAVLEKKNPGDTMTATVKRRRRDVEVQLRVFEVDGKNLLGAFLRPEYATKLPFEVKFETGTTSGASGGLVFALEIYNQLTPDDITKGRKIAATGTLEADGSIGGIEGINLKLIGAGRAGAQAILIPRANVKDVDGLPPDVEVISVGTFNEALDALSKL